MPCLKTISNYENQVGLRSNGETENHISFTRFCVKNLFSSSINMGRDKLTGKEKKTLVFIYAAKTITFLTIISYWLHRERRH